MIRKAVAAAMLQARRRVGSRLRAQGVAEGMTDYFGRGAVYVYERRIHVPKEFRNAGFRYGYWRVIPSSTRASVEAQATSTGWILVAEDKQLSTSTAGFGWASVRERAVRRLLGWAASSNIQVLEIVEVQQLKWLSCYLCTVTAQALEIVDRAKQVFPESEAMGSFKKLA